MADFELSRNTGSGGPGAKVVHLATISAQDGDTYDTGLGGGVDQAFVNAVGGNGNTANIENYDGSGTITLELVDSGGTTVASDESIDVVAFGQRS